MNLITLYKKMIPAAIQTRIRGKLFPLDELHIEKVKDTGVKVLDYLKEHPETWACLLFRGKTPSRYELEYYQKIRELGNPIALHVHISDILNPLPDIRILREQIGCSKARFETLFEQKITHIVPGQWNVNRAYLEVCRAMGLINLHMYHHKISEVTGRGGVPEGLSLIPVYRYIHDYQL